MTEPTPKPKPAPAPKAKPETDLLGNPLPPAGKPRHPKDDGDGHNQDWGLTLNDDEWDAIHEALAERVAEIAAEKKKKG